jgi:hypothetical protein
MLQLFISRQRFAALICLRLSISIESGKKKTGMIPTGFLQTSYPRAALEKLRRVHSRAHNIERTCRLTIDELLTEEKRALT